MAKDRNGISFLGTAVAFWKHGPCSTATMHVLDHAFDHPMETEEQGLIPHAGGIAMQGYQCGMLWGAALAAGAEAHKRLGPSPQAEAAAMRAARGLVESFRDRNKSVNCLELTDTDWKQKSQMFLNFLKGGPVTCTLMCARYTPVAFDVIQSTLSEEPPETSCTPASCASKLIRAMGLSEERAVVAAGFAGGIGLSGGGCGALGAAVWSLGMESNREELDYDTINARAGELIAPFLKVSDYEFECSDIVGRMFEDIDDHSRHVVGGGCSEIIETLAEATRAALSSKSEELGE